MKMEDLVEQMWDAADRMPPRNRDRLRATIEFRGGMGGSTVGVCGVRIGFDWTTDEIILVPDEPLVPHQWYSNHEEYLKHIGHEEGYAEWMRKRFEQSRSATDCTD